MITKISGKLLALDGESATLGIDPFEYEVLIAEFSRRQLQTHLGERVTLHTLHYIDGNPQQGKLVPRLVGFLNVVEREFFELFCLVDGVGVKKALRAMVRPVHETAILIEEQDIKGLSALPGIGAATAERIIAKLRRKMPRFALLKAREVAGEDAGPDRDLVRETHDVLCQLGHSEAEARKLLESALASGKKFKDTESLLQAIYQQTHGG